VKALVVGAGLAGAVAARALHDLGWGVEVTEAADRWGGQLHGATANRILYEPHGPHIFHTNDREVWNLVNQHVRMLPYRHFVLTEVNDQLFSWPPQLSELKRLREWPRIEHELSFRPPEPDGANFETWCIGLLGRTLYEWFVKPYTQKQWGMDPTRLSSVWAPKRIELRTDDDTHLFRDRYQGYPSGGYLRLIDSLLTPLPVSMGVEISADNLEASAKGFDAVVLTAPLDTFFSETLGALPWRGVRLVHRYLPGVTSLLAAPVVNHPGLDRAYTRRIETKLMSGQEVAGTVVSEEYPGSVAKHYPVDDAAGDNRRLAAAYQRLLGTEFSLPVVLAGRLATYTYINMDQAIRQGLNAAHRLDKGIIAVSNELCGS
jgi:UDP-galactopyranose mutase